jgi:fructosamine-3-kinase
MTHSHSTISIPRQIILGVKQIYVLHVVQKLDDWAHDQPWLPRLVKSFICEHHNSLLHNLCVDKERASVLADINAHYDHEKFHQTPKCAHGDLWASECVDELKWAPYDWDDE